jgi:hypothetical protein
MSIEDFKANRFLKAAKCPFCKVENKNPKLCDKTIMKTKYGWKCSKYRKKD